MRKSLDDKIQAAEDGLVNDLNQIYQIDLLDPPERDARKFITHFESLKYWLAQNDANTPQEFEIMVNSYFKDEGPILEAVLQGEFTIAISEKDGREMKKYLNNLAKAIALEKVKRRALAKLMELSLNK